MISLVNFFPNSLLSQQEQFKIVYTVRPYAICSPQPPFEEIRDSRGISWLEHIENEFHATGVKLFLDWSLFPAPSNPNFPSTKQLVKTLKLINKQELDLYIAVKLNSIPGFSVRESSGDLFQKKFDGQIAVIPKHTPMWDFANAKARNKMAKYYRSVLKLISHFAKPKEVIPVFTWDAEMEYEHRFFTGYSDSMQTYFREFLRARYHNSIDSLNLAWRQGNLSHPLASFDEVRVNPEWGNPKNHFLDFNDYPNSLGRLDWLQFRQYMLKEQYDFFKAINDEFGYKMPIQIGCTFDDRMERRGWTDITPLLKDADGIRVADIAGREDSFAFHATFLKSLMDYWRWRSTNDSRISNNSFMFSTEVNYPGYKGLSPQELTRSWSKQVREFYNRGADALFIHGWYKKNDKDFLKDCSDSYKSWLDTVEVYSKKKVKKIPMYTESVHFSSTRIPIIHGHNSNTNSAVENLNALKPFDSDYQIITDYMIRNSPEYLILFSTLYFTRHSEYISTSVLKSLLTHNISTEYKLSTFDSSLRKFTPVPGFKDEMGRNRSDLKVNFVWRTRKDLQALFPKGNKCDSSIAKRMNWPSTQDFIDWCVITGSIEYEGFNISYMNWSSDAVRELKMMPEWQRKFPDGYHNLENKGYTLLDILIEKAALDSTHRYKIFQNWPFLN